MTEEARRRTSVTPGPDDPVQTPTPSRTLLTGTVVAVGRVERRDLERGFVRGQPTVADYVYRPAGTVRGVEAHSSLGMKGLLSLLGDVREEPTGVREGLGVGGRYTTPEEGLKVKVGFRWSHLDDPQ